VTSPAVYRFADLTLDLGRRRLEREGQPIELGRLTYALLVALVEAAPNVLTHDDLVRRVWGGRATSHETVTQRIKLLRDALQDEAERPRYIALVRGQGYRLIPPVELLREATAAPAHAAAALPTASSDSRDASGAASAGRSPASRARWSRPAAAAAALVLVFAVGIAIRFVLWSSARPSAGSSQRDYEIVQLTSTGNSVMPAISPNGAYVAYVQMATDRWPRLMVRQIATKTDLEVVAPAENAVLYSPTFSPDGDFIDFVKSSGPSGFELWRVPLLGGDARRLRGAAATSFGWSPDGKRSAFVSYDEKTNTSLVARDAGGDEHVLARRDLPTYFVSLLILGSPPVRPAWSPDGSLIAVPKLVDILAPDIEFVDTTTGAETVVTSQGSFITQGLAWLDRSTLVLSQPGEFGQPIQLWRMTYPTGSVTPLTIDLASYIGVDLDASRTRLVSSRRNVRTSIWVGDEAGRQATALVPSTPFGTANVFLSWMGDRLLYDATFGGYASIAAMAPGSTAPAELVAHAAHVAAAPGGGAIVYLNTRRGQEGLWTTDAEGQHPRELVHGFAVEPVVTVDRSVVFVSNRRGVQSPWMVPLDGGEAHEIVHEFADAIDVSPDGRYLAYYAPGLNSAGEMVRGFVVCELPNCTNVRRLPIPPNCSGNPLRWTPDGKELACVAGHSGNIWATPIDGGAPHALTAFADAGWIVRFTWSRDGRRLAWVRVDVEQDIVLLTGLRP
jgi:DNA-binding winged helix-turn-helix (wHTH) protein/Tol biopolymer transport system component